MLEATSLRLLDAASGSLVIGTPVAHLGIGGQGIGLLIGAADGWHQLDGSLVQFEIGIGWTPPISLSHSPGNVEILGYTLPIGPICAGLRGVADPAPDALGGRLLTVTLKGGSGYGHELTVLFFLGSPFESFGDFALDVLSGGAMAAPGIGLFISLFGQARYVAAVVGGMFESSVSVGGAISSGFISYEAPVAAKPGATGAPSLGAIVRR